MEHDVHSFQCSFANSRLAHPLVLERIRNFRPTLSTLGSNGQLGMPEMCPRHQKECSCCECIVRDGVTGGYGVTGGAGDTGLRGLRGYGGYGGHGGTVTGSRGHGR